VHRHGFDMEDSMGYMRDAVKSGHWPLYRYDPDHETPFHLDSKAPTLPLATFAGSEARFAMLRRQ
jgi:pyruvate-ferredoxin/flavodoxin oxidoreductase